MYGMADKYAQLGQGGPNPYIDPARCKLEVDIAEAMFNAVLEQQKKAAAAVSRGEVAVSERRCRQVGHAVPHAVPDLPDDSGVHQARHDAACGVGRNMEKVL